MVDGPYTLVVGRCHIGECQSAGVEAGQGAAVRDVVLKGPDDGSAGKERRSHIVHHCYVQYGTHWLAAVIAVRVQAEMERFR